MFLGEYYTKFTGKGRVLLPKKFRSEILGNKLILSRGFEGCIWGFSVSDWEKEARRQLEISVTEERARLIRRYFFSASESVELDNQGRFIIPVALLDYAKINGGVVIIGAGDHFEIWDKVLWGKQLGKLERKLGRGRYESLR